MTTVQVGRHCTVDERVSLSVDYPDAQEPAVVGDKARIRSGTIIYADVVIGDEFTTGHNALIREKTIVGDNVLVGTNTIIDGNCELGSNVSLQSNVYIPSHTTIGDNVFVGPGAVMTNDPTPIRKDVGLEGPTLEDNVSVGANATILPGIRIGEGAFVAAGAVVTKDVPAGKLAVGAPARFHDMPEQLQGDNQI